jgi:hypothetical protein
MERAFSPDGSTTEIARVAVRLDQVRAFADLAPTVKVLHGRCGSSSYKLRKLPNCIIVAKGNDWGVW